MKLKVTQQVETDVPIVKALFLAVKRRVYEDFGGQVTRVFINGHGLITAECRSFRFDKSTKFGGKVVLPSGYKYVGGIRVTMEEDMLDLKVCGS